MLSNRRFRRPRLVVRAVRKLRAGAAALGYRRTRHLRVVPPPTPEQTEAHLAQAQMDAPPPTAPPKSKRSRNAFLLVLLVGLSFAVYWGIQETRSSSMQARIFTDLVGKMTYKMEPGASKAIRFPKDSPYDERLGYAGLPDYLGKLSARDYQVSAQVRISPRWPSWPTWACSPPTAKRPRPA